MAADAWAERYRSRARAGKLRSAEKVDVCAVGRCRVAEGDLPERHACGSGIDRRGESYHAACGYRRDCGTSRSDCQRSCRWGRAAPCLL